MTKKIVIMGGGIAGLTLAHQLCKFGSEYDIHIYERNTELGGQARSKKDESNKHSEYCWHAVGHGYVNFLPLMNEIPSGDLGCVADNLKPLENFIYAMENNNYIEYNSSFLTRSSEFLKGYKSLYGKYPPLKDILALISISLSARWSCDERVKALDRVLWSEYTKNLSPTVRRWVLDSMSIFCGMDYKNLSTHFMFEMLRHNTKPQGEHTFFSFNQSMNDVLFKPWEQYLISQGVKIHKQYTILYMTCTTPTYHDIKTDNPVCSVVSIEVKHKNEHSPKTIIGDIFVNALSAESLAHLYPSNLKSHQRYKKLAELGEQLQTQVLFRIDYKIETPPGGTIVILPDSEWFLMIRIEGNLWDLENKDLLSVGIGMWDVAGTQGLTALECNKSEIAKECWRQIKKSQHGLDFPSDMPEWDIWYSYKFDYSRNTIKTWEPKWSNSCHTLELRPEIGQDCEIIDLYHCGSICKTQQNTYNMEGAVESGKTVADLIHFGRIVDPLVIQGYKKVYWYESIFRWIDSIVFWLFRN